jgi:hypothetical protein
MELHLFSSLEFIHASDSCSISLLVISIGTRASAIHILYQTNFGIDLCVLEIFCAMQLFVFLWFISSSLIPACDSEITLASHLMPHALSLLTMVCRPALGILWFISMVTIPFPLD